MSRRAIHVALPLPRDATIRSLRFLPDGELLAAATKMYGTFNRDDDADLLQVWRVGGSLPVGEWPITHPGRRHAVTHPHGQMVVTSADGELAAWALSGGQPLWRASPHSWANGMAFSPDGRLLATVGPYGPRDNLADVELRNAQSGELVFSLSPGIASCDAVAFSPDGTRLAVAGTHDDPYLGSLFVWSTDGRKLVEREHELGGQTEIEFTADGEFVVFADKKVHVWDARSGEPVRVIEPRRGEVFTRVFAHPGGRELVTTVWPERSVVDDLSDERVDEVGDVFDQYGAGAFEELIRRELERRKAEPPKPSTMEVAKLDFGSGRELVRYRQVATSQPVEGAGYHGGGAALSPDGAWLAVWGHTSINLMSLDGNV